jgi:hypothetical protein
LALSLDTGTQVMLLDRTLEADESMVVLLRRNKT